MAGLAVFLAAWPDLAEIRIAAVRGSSPREAGARMWVAPGAAHGTIGGGQLEYLAIDEARRMLARGRSTARMDVPLGPEIGQCCGGRVRLALRRVTAEDRRALAAEEARRDAALPHVYVMGAGHVGRALARALALLPVRTILVDGRAEELGQCAAPVDRRLCPLPEAEIRAAPPGSAFVVLTHDHALDFLLAAEALGRGDAAYVGLIGSTTKRAKFASFCRVEAGVSIHALTCPIGGRASRDKRPEVIAAFAAAEIMAALAGAARSGGSARGREEVRRETDPRGRSAMTPAAPGSGGE